MFVCWGCHNKIPWTFNNRHGSGGCSLGAASAWSSLGRALFLACRWLPSRCVFTAERGEASSLPSSYKETNPLTKAPPPWPCKVVVSKYHHLEGWGCNMWIWRGHNSVYTTHLLKWWLITDRVLICVGIIVPLAHLPGRTLFLQATYPWGYWRGHLERNELRLNPIR